MYNCKEFGDFINDRTWYDYKFKRIQTYLWKRMERRCLHGLRQHCCRGNLCMGTRTPLSPVEVNAFCHQIHKYKFKLHGAKKKFEQQTLKLWKKVQDEVPKCSLIHLFTEKGKSLLTPMLKSIIQLKKLLLLEKFYWQLSSLNGV